MRHGVVIQNIFFLLLQWQNGDIQISSATFFIKNFSGFFGVKKKSKSAANVKSSKKVKDLWPNLYFLSPPKRFLKTSWNPYNTKGFVHLFSSGTKETWKIRQMRSYFLRLQPFIKYIWYVLIGLFMVFFKDTYRKICKIGFIYVCGSKNGSRSSSVNTGEVWGTVHVWLGIWNQNSNTVIYEEFCSYISIKALCINVSSLYKLVMISKLCRLELLEKEVLYYRLITLTF